MVFQISDCRFCSCISAVLIKLYAAYDWLTAGRSAIHTSNRPIWFFEFMLALGAFPRTRLAMIDLKRRFEQPTVSFCVLKRRICLPFDCALRLRSGEPQESRQHDTLIIFLW